MSGEFSKNTQEASDKLANLSQLFPEDNLNPQVVEFSSLLSNRLNLELSPIGFVMASHLLIYDLKDGINGFNGEQIDSRLSKQPTIVYEFLLDIVPDLAEVAFSESFANEVRTMVASLLDKPEKEVTEKSKLAEVLSRPIPGMSQTEEQISTIVEPVETAPNEYEAVGRWWASKLLNPEFNNGGTDEINIMAKMLARISSRERQTDTDSKKISDFAKVVSELSRERKENSIYVDYDADPLLMEAANIVGIEVADIMTFPWKTGTEIKDGIVFARSGYQSERLQIWPPLDKESLSSSEN